MSLSTLIKQHRRYRSWNKTRTGVLVDVGLSIVLLAILSFTLDLDLWQIAPALTSISIVMIVNWFSAKKDQ